MSGIQINEAKAPWVMFDRRPEEDRTESIKEGRYVAKDVDYVLITPHGSRDQVERVVTEWFGHLEQQVREGRFEEGWLKQYKNAYENWSAGKAIPLDGTPILNWPLVSPAQVRMLQDLHVLTVEVLAQGNEELIKRLGMGGRNLVDKAKEFLKQVETGKGVEAVVAQNARIEQLEATVKTLQEQNSLLAAQVPKQEGGPPTQASSNISTDDLLDKPTLKKL